MLGARETRSSPWEFSSSHLGMYSVLITKTVWGSLRVLVSWGRRFLPRERSLIATPVGEHSIHTCITEGCSVPSLLWSSGQWGLKRTEFLSPCRFGVKLKLGFCAQATPIAEDEAVIQTRILNSRQPLYLLRRNIQAFLTGFRGLLPSRFPNYFTFFPHTHVSCLYYSSKTFVSVLRSVSETAPVGHQQTPHSTLESSSKRKVETFLNQGRNSFLQCHLFWCVTSMTPKPWHNTHTRYKCLLCVFAIDLIVYGTLCPCPCLLQQ